MRYAAALLGIAKPQSSGNVACVTGTNGKGSTCAYLEALLRAQGRQTVVLTSPHTNSLRERIRLNGETVGKEEFMGLLRAASPVLEQLRGSPDQLSPTMVVVLLALLAHQRLGSDACGIYEVGAGGKRDATNVFENAVVALTEVGHDHVKDFGGSLLTLIEEKLGLLRPRGRLVYVAQRTELEAAVVRTVSEMRVLAERIGSDDLQAAGSWLTALVAEGVGQMSNALLAYRVCELLLGVSADPAALVERARSHMHLPPGRFERRLIDGRHFLLDGAHNVPAVSGLMGTLSRSDTWRDCVGILGFSRDKEWQLMLAEVARAGVFSVLIVTRSIRPRGADPEIIRDCAAALGIRCVSADNLADALRRLSHIQPTVPVVIFGSLLLLSDFDRSLHAIGSGKWARPWDDIDPWQPWMAPLP